MIWTGDVIITNAISCESNPCAGRGDGGRGDRASIYQLQTSNLEPQTSKDSGSNTVRVKKKSMMRNLSPHRI